MIKVYGVLLARRFFPDKKFEKITGIVGRTEVVTLGNYCVGEQCEVVEFVETEYFEKLLHFQDDSLNGLRVAESITEEEAVNIIDAQKKNLKCGSQLLYFEIYQGKKFNNLTGFEFCGYELTDKFCSVSLVTGNGEMTCQQLDRLNKYGLFATIEEAITAQKQIRESNLCEDAANSVIYGVWRYLKGSKTNERTKAGE